MNGVAVSGIQASYVNSSVKMSTTTDVNDLADTPKEGTPIFLQTRAAQGIAGVFVWVALFLTCQQVLAALHRIELDDNGCDINCRIIVRLCLLDVYRFISI